MSFNLFQVPFFRLRPTIWVEASADLGAGSHGLKPPFTRSRTVNISRQGDVGCFSKNSVGTRRPSGAILSERQSRKETRKWDGVEVLALLLDSKTLSSHPDFDGGNVRMPNPPFPEDYFRMADDPPESRCSPRYRRAVPLALHRTPAGASSRIPRG
jgi:hypothetical protein